MPVYQKKTVTIEAVAVDDIIAAALGDWSAMPGWLHDLFQSDRLLIRSSHLGLGESSTDDCPELAVPGDWLICEGDSIRVCSGRVFKDLYEPVAVPSGQGVRRD
jgi:hypothetical protein